MKPLLVETRSRTALGAGVVVPMPTLPGTAAYMSSPSTVQSPSVTPAIESTESAMAARRAQGTEVMRILGLSSSEASIWMPIHRSCAAKRSGEIGSSPPRMTLNRPSATVTPECASSQSGSVPGMLSG